MITITLLIFYTLRIVNLGNIIVKINIIRAIILTITTTKITMAISHGKESVMFVVKKVVALINIQIISNRRQKNFGDKIENSAKIKPNITLFWPIIKRIQMMT